MDVNDFSLGFRPSASNHLRFSSANFRRRRTSPPHYVQRTWQRVSRMQLRRFVPEQQLRRRQLLQRRMDVPGHGRSAALVRDRHQLTTVWQTTTSFDGGDDLYSGPSRSGAGRDQRGEQQDRRGRDVRPIRNFFDDTVEIGFASSSERTGDAAAWRRSYLPVDSCSGSGRPSGEHEGPESLRRAFVGNPVRCRTLTRTSRAARTRHTRWATCYAATHVLIFSFSRTTDLHETANASSRLFAQAGVDLDARAIKPMRFTLLEVAHRHAAGVCRGCRGSRNSPRLEDLVGVRRRRAVRALADDLRLDVRGVLGRDLVLDAAGTDVTSRTRGCSW